MDLLAAQDKNDGASGRRAQSHRDTVTFPIPQNNSGGFGPSDYIKACTDFQALSQNLLGPKGLQKLHQAISKEGIYGAGGLVEMYFGDLIESRAAMEAELQVLVERKQSLGLEIANEALELREQLANKFQEVIAEREKAIEKNAELIAEQARDNERHLDRISILKAEIRDLELRRHEIRSEQGLELDAEATKVREGKQIQDGFASVLRGLRTLCGFSPGEFPKDVPQYIHTTLVPALLDFESKYGETSRAILIGQMLEGASKICSGETAINLFPVYHDNHAHIFPSDFSNWLASISSPQSNLKSWCERVSRFAQTTTEVIPLLLKELKMKQMPQNTSEGIAAARAYRDSKMQQFIGGTSLQLYLINVPELEVDRAKY